MASNTLEQAERMEIWITGMGAVSAAGVSADALWASTAAGVMSGSEIEWPAMEGKVLACSVAAIPLERSEQRWVRKLDRSAALALAAALQAWQGANLERMENRERIGLIVGSARGPAARWAESVTGSASRRYRPTLAASTTMASVSGALSCRLGIGGPCHVVSASCVSSALAVGDGARLLVLGDADVVLVGGAEAPLLPWVIGPLKAAGLIAPGIDPATACRPFDRHRNGMIPGEGAAFLVLESRTSGIRRGVRPMARLLGWATTADGYGRTSADPEGAGLASAVERALSRASCRPEDIGYINAHGTGTVLNDLLEVVGLRRVFGPRLAQVPCSSTKPVTGHCLGASPALEAVLAVNALRHQLIPPTATCEQVDPECQPLDPVCVCARPAKLRHVLSVSSGFWGNHAALVFGQCADA